MKTLKIVLLTTIFLWAGSALAQQLTYSFTNPSFGGSPLNGSWLLQSAQVQSDYKQKDKSSTATAQSELDEFAKNLNNQILYTLANNIIQKQFGSLDGGLKNGQYSVGKYRINIGTGPGGLTVTIFDNTNGNQTQVTIPNY